MNYKCIYIVKNACPERNPKPIQVCFFLYALYTRGRFFSFSKQQGLPKQEMQSKKISNAQIMSLPDLTQMLTKQVYQVVFWQWCLLLKDLFGYWYYSLLLLTLSTGCFVLTFYQSCMRLRPTKIKTSFMSAHLKPKNWAVVVVKWSACSPSTLTIRVRIQLKPTAFCSI